VGRALQQVPRNEEEDEEEGGDDPVEKDEGDDDNEDDWKQDDGPWGGMDPSDLSNINDALMKVLKWNKDQVDEFANAGDGGGLLDSLVVQMQKQGYDKSSSIRVAKQYRHALNEERRKQHQWIIRKKKQMLRPIIECVACGRSWCDYMPRIVRWERYDVWVDEYNPYKELE
jgi:hypothetical protein